MNTNANETFNYLTQLNKESFKTKYKFIDFKKSNICQEATSTTNENLKEFYEDLIEQTQTQTTTTTNKIIETNSNQISHKNPVNKVKLYTQNEYLKAAQTNHLNIIESVLAHDSSKLNLKDDYKWNALMIAVASHNNDIVKYFFQKQTNNNLFIEFLNAQDSAGNTAETLAIKFNNNTALKLIKEFHSLKIESHLEKPETSKVESSEFYCELCKLSTFESEINHLKSMTHLINENETQTDKNKLTYNYHLRSSNKGYRLLCQSGWNEQSGLGKDEQGNRFPIKTKLKLDREGIGLEKSESKKQTSCRGILETSFKSLSEIKKKDKRMKRLERNLRFEFNN